LVPPRSPEAMAEKVIYLLQHPKTARQMGEKGYQEVSKYDYSLMVSRLEELYLQLIERSDLPLLIAKRGTPPPG
ncbi:MAG: glycosyltransferase, partial [Acidobacteriota bacterium]